MNVKYLLISTILLLVAQTLVWYQVHLQFMYKWFKDNEWVMGVVAVPITYLFLYATKYGYLGFNGVIWPTRFVQFSAGMVVFAFLAYYHMNEPITLKTGVCIILALSILLVQVLWK